MCDAKNTIVAGGSQQIFKSMAKILLVDDDAQLSLLLGELLTHMSYEVELLDHGYSAREALKTRSFDAIILDWDLPDAKGPDLCREFREMGGTTPVMLLTGRSGIGGKELGFEVGADDYLTKPFHPKELCARLKAMLKRASGYVKVTQGAEGSDPGAKREAGLPADDRPGDKSAQSGGGERLAPRPADPNYWQPTGAAAVVHSAQANPLDRYEILGSLGEGAMGLVYKALDKMLNRTVAIKMLKPSFIYNQQSLSRFKTEAQAVGQLSHANIITIYDFGVTPEGVPYLVMEWLAGRDLSHVLVTEHQLELKRALPLFIQACDALVHAHERGIIHRDLKPSNMMLLSVSGRETIKLVDFGIAKLLTWSSMEVVDVTKPGEIFGSPLYMSPEQCMGVPIDHRSDIFSLGYILYQSLTGIKLFLGNNEFETMYKRTVEKPLPLNIVRPDLQLPTSMESIIFKCLAVDPNERYGSVSDLKFVLERVAQKLGSH